MSFWIKIKMPTLVEKFGNFAKYEFGDPMLKGISHNYVQTEFNLIDRKYFEALKSAVKTLSHTALEAAWLGMSVIEIRALEGIAHGLYSGDLERTAEGAGAIVLFELIKDIMNNPQRYSLVRPRRGDGTISQ